MKLTDREITILLKVLKSFDLARLESEEADSLRQIIEKLSGKNRYELFADGASDLHSGTAGIGGVIMKDGAELYSFSEFIGRATNNEAEYKALIRGLELLSELNCAQARVYLDSELVVKQVNGHYKVKNERMRELHTVVMSLSRVFDHLEISHISREKNKVADRYSKAGMMKGRTSAKRSGTVK